MLCYEDREDDKNENGDGENKLESKNPEDDEKKWVLEHPGTLKNPKEPHRRSRTFLRLKSRTNGR